MVTTSQGGGGGKGGIGRRAAHHHHRVPLLRELRRRAGRRRDRRPRPRVGRRQRARPLNRHPPPLHRQRDAGPRQPDRGAGRRRQRAGLPRPRLHRVRASGARQLRQPHPAALLRGAPRRRSASRRACAPSPSFPAPASSSTRKSPSPAKLGAATNVSENVHTRQGGTDWAVSIDQLQATLPNVGSVSLIVGWFGNDLRAGHCDIRPGVDAADKITEPLTWSVAGLARDDAHLVSTVDGRAAYGGTPSDETVVAAIQDLEATAASPSPSRPSSSWTCRSDNTLPDPYTGTIGQPPTPGAAASPSRPRPASPARPTRPAPPQPQVAAFVGTADVADFAIDGESVIYSGPAEWSFRRLILHYAHLAAAAGGVDAFVIGTEMRGLTTVRDSAFTYPFVTALAALAADVKAVLGSDTKVTYAADWSEYFGHQPADGSGDVYFHLDPLWSSEHRRHRHRRLLAAGRLARRRSCISTASPAPLHLRSRLPHRQSRRWRGLRLVLRQRRRPRTQIRTPITDGGAGKPWVFRFKDIRSWWLNQHFNRPGGTEASNAHRLGAAVASRYLAHGARLSRRRQRRQPAQRLRRSESARESHPALFLRTASATACCSAASLPACHEASIPSHANYIAGVNPVDAVYSGRMVDLDAPARLYWDARPYPAFPADAAAWGDGPELGASATGSTAASPVRRSAATVGAILADHGFDARDRIVAPRPPRRPPRRPRHVRARRHSSHSSSPSSSTPARAAAASSSPTAAPPSRHRRPHADVLVETRRVRALSTLRRAHGGRSPGLRRDHLSPPQRLSPGSG